MDFTPDYSDGGKDYVYVLDGIENHCLVPPSSFDPLNASDEELEKYCFQPRPSDKSKLNEWKNLMCSYRNTPIPKLSVNNMKRTHEHSYDSTSTYASYSTRYSKIWSGYESNLGTNPANTYSQVQMDYIQPTISSVNGTCFNSYWVGLGGRNSGKLVQAGTATQNTNTHYAWYEYLSDNATSVTMQKIESLTINAGDSIHTYISFEKENNKFTYYIANNTTGCSASGYVLLNASNYYDGTTAEWIVERCSNGVGPYHLGEYGTITISNCKCKFLNVANWYDLTSCSGLYKVIMSSNQSYSGRILSTPGSPYNANCFSCVWKGYY